jgi:hypothetical protein
MRLRQELRPMLRLALPVVLSDLGWMLMGIVDTMMVGRIIPGTAIAIGAVSIGSIFFYTVAMFGGGLMLGLDTLVSHAYGAGRRHECYRSLLSGLYLIVPLAFPPGLLRPAALSAGDQRGGAGRICAGHSEPRQCDGQLDFDLRPSRRSSDGHGRIGVVHGRGAKLHGGHTRGLCAFPGLAVAHFAQSGFSAHS